MDALNLTDTLTTIVLNLASIVALLWATMKFFSHSVKRKLVKTRRHFVLRVYWKLAQNHQAGISKRDLVKKDARFIEKLIDGHDNQVVDEIDHLSEAAKLKQAFTFLFESNELREMAWAYRRAASEYRRFNIFTLNSDLIDKQVSLADKMAELFFNQAEYNHKNAQLLPQIGRIDDVDKRISYWDFPTSKHNLALDVSWFKQIQLIGHQTVAGQLVDRPGVSFDRGSRVQFIQGQNVNNQIDQEYNGVLPTIIELAGQPQVELVRDGRNGAQTLRLSLAQSTYQSVQRLRDMPADTPINRVMTLSMLILTVEGEIILMTRSETSETYAEQLTPSVNGNVDMPTRYYHNEDADEYGRPSPFKAIVREAQEELNLDLDTSRIIVRGLGRLKTEKDNGTWVLAMSYQSELTAAEIESRFLIGSNILGRYELADKIEVIKIHELQKLLADDSRKLMPHLRIALNYELMSIK